MEENLLAAEEMAALQLARYEPVVYCYELQLAQPVHRKGLGRRLMQMLELLVRGPPGCRAEAAVMRARACACIALLNGGVCVDVSAAATPGPTCLAGRRFGLACTTCC